MLYFCVMDIRVPSNVKIKEQSFKHSRQKWLILFFLPFVKLFFRLSQFFAAQSKRSIRYTGLLFCFGRTVGLWKSRGTKGALLCTPVFCAFLSMQHCAWKMCPWIRNRPLSRLGRYTEPCRILVFPKTVKDDRYCVFLIACSHRPIEEFLNFWQLAMHASFAVLRDLSERRYGVASRGKRYWPTAIQKK